MKTNLFMLKHVKYKKKFLPIQIYVLPNKNVKLSIVPIPKFVNFIKKNFRKSWNFLYNCDNLIKINNQKLYNIVLMEYF